MFFCSFNFEVVEGFACSYTFMPSEFLFICLQHCGSQSRNLPLFCCVFQSRYHARSAIVQNFPVKGRVHTHWVNTVTTFTQNV